MKLTLQKVIYKKYKWGEEITLDMSEWTDYISQTKEFLKEVSNENTDFNKYRRNILQRYSKQMLCIKKF